MSLEARVAILHDLRSRFAVIQACTEMLTDPGRNLESDQRLSLAKLASDNVTRLRSLVEGLDLKT